MKILMVNKFLHPNGGSETYIFNLGNELICQGHKVQYFGMEHEKRVVGNQLGVYTNNMDFHTGKLQKLLYPFKIIYSTEAYKKMLQILQNFQPDVVHLNNINFQLTPSIIFAIKKYRKLSKHKVKLVATAHDYQWVCPNHMLMIPSSKKLCFACEGGKYSSCTKNKCIHNSMVKSLLGTIEAQFYQWNRIYEEIDTIICPSDFLNQKLSTNKAFKGRTVTLHNFLIPQETDEENQMLKLPEKYVLYFGRYAHEKGIADLLRICRQLPEIQFVFAGSGPLEEEVNKTQNVINLGFQNGNALKTLISNAEFFVFASQWYENCPFAVMESQMYGVPVVASDLGGTKELIQDKVTGELYSGTDMEKLQEIIVRLWNNRETVAFYKENCKNLPFLDLTQYCNKILQYYN